MYIITELVGIEQIAHQLASWYWGILHVSVTSFVLWIDIFINCTFVSPLNTLLESPADFILILFNKLSRISFYTNHPITFCGVGDLRKRVTCEWHYSWHLWQWRLHKYEGGTKPAIWLAKNIITVFIISLYMTQVHWHVIRIGIFLRSPTLLHTSKGKNLWETWCKSDYHSMGYKWNSTTFML